MRRSTNLCLAALLCLAPAAHAALSGIVSGTGGTGGGGTETFNASHVRVIWEGSSLSTETSPPAGAGNTWPELLRQYPDWRRLHSYTNAARGSRQAADIFSQYRTNVTGRWIGSAGVDQVIYFAESGINDILQAGKDGPQTWAFVRSNLLDAARDGCKVVAFTIATNVIFGGPDPNYNIRRVDYNGIVRSNANLYDVLIDLDQLLSAAGTNTDVFIEGIHYTRTYNGIIASNIVRALSPAQHSIPLNWVNGSPTNQFDGITLGNVFLGNYAALSHTFNYWMLCHASLRSNANPAGLFMGPGGDTWYNTISGGSIAWRINNNNYMLLDSADGILKVLGGALNIPGGSLNSERAFITNNISYLATNVTGTGTGNTNYTIQATHAYQYLGGSNVSITAIMQGQVGFVREVNLVITNLTSGGGAIDWGLRFSSVSNAWRFSGPNGTNQPTVLSNNLARVVKCRINGSNVLATVEDFRPPLLPL